jgi:hypothetical protein
MSYKEIMEGIQSTINSNVRRDEKPILLGVSKPTKEGTVRIWCETEDEANLLWDINWETATKAFQARKPNSALSFTESIKTTSTPPSTTSQQSNESKKETLFPSLK